MPCSIAGAVSHTWNEVYQHMEHLYRCGLLTRTGQPPVYFYDATLEGRQWMEYACDEKKWGDHWEELQTLLSTIANRSDHV